MHLAWLFQLRLGPPNHSDVDKAGPEHLSGRVRQRAPARLGTMARFKNTLGKHSRCFSTCNKSTTSTGKSPLDQTHSNFMSDYCHASLDTTALTNHVPLMIGAASNVKTPFSNCFDPEHTQSI